MVKPWELIRFVTVFVAGFIVEHGHERGYQDDDFQLGKLCMMLVPNSIDRNDSYTFMPTISTHTLANVITASMVTYSMGADPTPTRRTRTGALWTRRFPA